MPKDWAKDAFDRVQYLVRTCKICQQWGNKMTVCANGRNFRRVKNK